MGDFQKTVNLREKFEKEKAERMANLYREAGVEKEKINKPVPEKEMPFREGSEAKNNVKAIDKLFGKDLPKRDEMQKISRPKSGGFNYRKFRSAVFVIIAIIILGGTFWLVQKREKKIQESAAPMEEKWYAVKLVNGEIYYGKIKDNAADPVVMNSVYYDYDQVNKNATEVEPKKDPSSLRLVKRGKETHGPEGTLDVVRAQVVYMEPLRADSKVLKAILENEK